MYRNQLKDNPSKNRYSHLNPLPCISNIPAFQRKTNKQTDLLIISNPGEQSKLFTVPYFSVRLSRSSALGNRRPSWFQMFRVQPKDKPRHPPLRYIMKPRYIVARTTQSSTLTILRKNLMTCSQSKRTEFQNFHHNTLDLFQSSVHNSNAQKNYQWHGQIMRETEH